MGFRMSENACQNPCKNQSKLGDTTKLLLRPEKFYYAQKNSIWCPVFTKNLFGLAFLPKIYYLPKNIPAEVFLPKIYLFTKNLCFDNLNSIPNRGMHSYRDAQKIYWVVVFCPF